MYNVLNTFVEIFVALQHVISVVCFCCNWIVNGDTVVNLVVVFGIHLFICNIWTYFNTSFVVYQMKGMHIIFALSSLRNIII